MSSYENIQKNQEEFVNYLEQYGILDQITDTLIMLYVEPEQPSDPVDYVRKNLYQDNPDVREIKELETLIESATVKLSELKKTRDELKDKLEKLQYNEAGCELEETDDVLSHRDEAKEHEVK